MEIDEINASVQSYLGILKHCDSHNLTMSVIGQLEDEILNQLDLKDV